MKNRSEGIDFGFGIKQAIGASEVKHVSKCYWTKEEFGELSTYVFYVCYSTCMMEFFRRNPLISTKIEAYSYNSDEPTHACSYNSDVRCRRLFL